VSDKFAAGNKALGLCDRCGQRFLLKELRKLTIKTKLVPIKVCKECWEPDQPQLKVGLYPVHDFQALREPRPDLGFYSAGHTGLQTTIGDNGYPSDGSRVFQWGWYPVGGSELNIVGLTPNYLTAIAHVGIVTITTS